MTEPVGGAELPVTGTGARHALDVPVVAAVGRHDGRMIAEPAEYPAVAHAEGAQ